MSRIKKYVFALVGIIIMGFGCGMLVKTGIGTDTVNCLTTGIANSLKITVGQATTLFNVVVVIAVFFIDKKMIKAAMILSVFLTQYPIDYAINIYFKAPNLMIGILSDILSIYVFTLGAAMMICSDCGSNVYDGLILAVSNITKKKYIVIKYIADGLFILIGYLLGGEVGVGTIISFILVGFLINEHMKFINKRIKPKILN